MISELAHILADERQAWSDQWTLPAKYQVVGAPVNRAPMPTLIRLQFPFPITISLVLDGPINPADPNQKTFEINSGIGDVVTVQNGVHCILTDFVQIGPYDDSSDWFYNPVAVESPRWVAKAGISFSPITVVV